VSDAGNGYGAVSMTWAKKEILGMSEDEIKLDVQRQAVEKAGGEELKMLAETIKQTGLFREIYKAYKINPENMTTAGAGGTTESGSELDAAISGGGSGVGMDFTTPLETPETGAEGGETEIETAAGVTEPIEEPIENLAEITKKKMEKRRGKINESLNKTIQEINNLIKD
jgi:hypothetical protein